MLEEITWKEFISTIGIITGLWYIAIAALYYRKEIGKQVQGLNPAKKSLNTFKQTQRVIGTKKVSDDPYESGFAELESIVHDLRIDILEKAGSAADKNQLLFEMQLLLSTYDGIKKNAFRVAINHFIISQANELCGVEFSEEELEKAWEAL